MNTRNQLVLLHCAIPMIFFVLVGAFVMPGWIPPPSPGLSPEEVAGIFTPDNFMMRLGILLMLVFCPLLVAFSSVIATQLKRIEGKHHTMASAQLACCSAGMCLFLLPGFIWMAISYRTNVPPEVIMVFNDLAWFMWFAGIGPTLVQWCCIGYPIISDRSNNPVYPRWFGFLNFWVALGACATLLIPFVYGGPFGYNGLFGFGFPAIMFSIWVITAYWCSLQAITNQAKQAVLQTG